MDLNLTKFWETVEDRGDWRAVVHGVSKSWTWLSDWTAIQLLQWCPCIFKCVLVWTIIIWSPYKKKLMFSPLTTFLHASNLLLHRCSSSQLLAPPSFLWLKLEDKNDPVPTSLVDSISETFPQRSTSHLPATVSLHTPSSLAWVLPWSLLSHLVSLLQNLVSILFESKVWSCHPCLNPCNGLSLPLDEECQKKQTEG